MNLNKPGIIYNTKLNKKWMGLVTQNELKLFAELAIMNYDKNFDKERFEKSWLKVIKQINSKIRRKNNG